MLTANLTPKELIYKHIFDRTHVVTEEELKNVTVGFASLTTESTEERLTGEANFTTNKSYRSRLD